MKANLEHMLVFPLFFILVLGCSENGDHANIPKASNSLVQPGAPGVDYSNAVIYADIRPIFETHCMRCHSNFGPNWLDPQQAVKYGQNGILKKRVFTQKSMPQVGSPESQAITIEERELIASWVDWGSLIDRPAPGEVIAPPVGDGSGGSGGSGGGSDIPGGKDYGVANLCVGCHGAEAPGSNSRIPYLAGQNREYILRQLDSFATNKRTDRVLSLMNGVAASLTAEDKAAVADIFSQMQRDLPVVEIKTPTFPRFNEVMNDCFGCHFENGNRSKKPEFPNLAGLPSDYLVDQLGHFKAGRRSDFIKGGEMNALAGSLSDEEIRQLAEYFSTLRFE